MLILVFTGKSEVKFNFRSIYKIMVCIFFYASFGNMWLLPYGFAYPLIDPPPFYNEMKTKGKP